MTATTASQPLTRRLTDTERYAYENRLVTLLNNLTVQQLRTLMNRGDKAGTKQDLVDRASMYFYCLENSLKHCPNVPQSLIDMICEQCAPLIADNEIRVTTSYILHALKILENENEMLYDLWREQLYGDGDTLLPDRLTADNLQAIQRDARANYRGPA